MARAVLVIADIGGYTKFMKVHRINLAHAQYVVAQLLEAVIDGAGNKLELAKLEGDAAFFYATLPEKKDVDLEPYARAITNIRREFLRKRESLAIDRVCSCDGCVQAGELRLKFVAHVGDVAFQKVKRFTELAGVDVILVHRLLKNSVPVPEYVLTSDAAHPLLPSDFRERTTTLEEELEGLGMAKLHYVDLEKLEIEKPEVFRSSWFGRVWGWIKMTLSSLPYFVGAKKSCEGFRNVGELLPETTPTLLPPSPESKRS